MEERMLQEAADRVRRMEEIFDALEKAADENPAAVRENRVLQDGLRILTGYYESGRWLQDYELDEKGLFPQGMKRGVLAQDAVYDLLERLEH